MSRCEIGIIRTQIKKYSQLIFTNKTEKAKAPRTKSSWSSPGAGLPRGIFNLLLMNAPQMSPTKAPNPSRNPRSQLCCGSQLTEIKLCKNPVNVPMRMPKNRPSQVFPEPSKGCPNKFFPKSILRLCFWMNGIFPAIGGVMLASPAGRKNQSD